MVDPQVTLTLHFPERSIKNHPGDPELPNTGSSLPVTLMPTDPLSEIRTNLAEMVECYCLGSYAFRKNVRDAEGNTKKINGKPVLSGKLPEFTELSNIFDLSPESTESLDLFITHGTFYTIPFSFFFLRRRTSQVATKKWCEIWNSACLPSPNWFTTSDPLLAV